MDFELTILTYARALLATPELSWAAQHDKIKGRGHVNRVRLDRHNPLIKLLPAIRVADERVAPKSLDGEYRVGYRVHFYCSTELMKRYTYALLAAGIDLPTQTVIHPRAWRRAATVLRLTGAPLHPETWDECAAQVTAALERRADRAEKHFREMAV